MEKKLPDILAESIISFPSQRPLRVMFQDEARFRRISDCWAKFPMRPIVKAMLTHQYVYAYGAVSILDGAFDSLVLAQESIYAYPRQYTPVTLATIFS